MPVIQFSPIAKYHQSNSQSNGGHPLLQSTGLCNFLFLGNYLAVIATLMTSATKSLLPIRPFPQKSHRKGH